MLTGTTLSSPRLLAQEDPAAAAQNTSPVSAQKDAPPFDSSNARPEGNATFLARFEKYLNTPEENTEAEQSHRRILNQIAGLLEPTTLNAQSISTAFRLLTRATYFPGDSRLSDTLANGIYEIWQTKRNSAQIGEANRILEEEKRALQNSMVAAAKAGSRPDVAMQQGFRAAKIFQKDTKMASNAALGQLSEIQAKVSYQGLLAQLYLQRRFHHLLIGARFYRAIFDDADSRLHTTGSMSAAKEAPGGAAGSPPSSVSLMETVAKESIQDVQTNIAAFHQHFQKDELRAATERLREALMIGEFLPELRTLPLAIKRKIHGYFQKTSQLKNALEAKDYTLAKELLEAEDGLQKMASDFDSGPARNAIETAQRTSELALKKAQLALQDGDKSLFEKQLTEAAGIWPNNPALIALTSRGFQQADEQAAALKELDSLISRNDYRRIAEQSARFLVAVQFAAIEKQASLREILELSKNVEGTLGLASEMDQQGNSAGAWEKVSSLSESLPEEPRLLAAKNEYAQRAAPFVQALQKAQTFRDQARLAQSIAWFLKAQKIHPTSTLARESLEALCPRILEDLR